MGSSDEDTGVGGHGDAAERAAQALRALLAACAEVDAAHRRQFGLNISEQQVLALLAGGMTAPTELSQSVGMSTAGMTSVLDRLEQDELIRRTPHATDGRRVLITLTKEGLLATAQFDAIDIEVLSLARNLTVQRAELVAQFLADAAQRVARSPDEPERFPLAHWTKLSVHL